MSHCTCQWISCECVSVKQSFINSFTQEVEFKVDGLNGRIWTIARKWMILGQDGRPFVSMVQMKLVIQSVVVLTVNFKLEEFGFWTSKVFKDYSRSSFWKINLLFPNISWEWRDIKYCQITMSILYWSWNSVLKKNIPRSNDPCMTVNPLC